MNIAELKNILNSKHINSWVKIYKDSSVIQDYLFLLYGTRASTDIEIYAVLYLVMHDLPEIPKSFCGENAKFLKYGKGYAKFCEKYDRSLKLDSCACCHTELYKSRNKKAKETNVLKYGNEIPQQTDLVKNKVKETNLTRYGTESHNSNSIIKDKKVTTYIERYGVDNPSKLQEVKDLKIASALENYGVEHFLQSNERYKNDIIKRYNRVLQMAQEVDYTLNCTIDEFSETKYFDHISFICNKCKKPIESSVNVRLGKCSCQKLSGTSLAEKDLYDYIAEQIPDVEILTSVRSLIAPKEVDIYIPSLNLAFEFNGMYWHSTIHKDKNFHQSKVLECKAKGVNLIHVYEDEWNDAVKQEIIKERIKNKLHESKKIYARKCTIRNVDSEVSNTFIEKHHIQGSTTASINIGLYYGDDLVAVMTFGKSRFDKSIDYELIRYCSTGTVIGGASKLLKYFELMYNPTSLVSYADMNWSNGNLYEKIGFTQESITKPGYFYYNPKNKERISRQRCQKHKLVSQGHDSSMTETEICCDVLGYYKIYDSGNYKFLKRY